MEMEKRREEEPIVLLEGADIGNADGTVLRNVSLSLESGGFAYIAGKVGSGKSTIIKSLIAEYPIRGGKARIGDFNLLKIKRRQIPYLRRSVGVVFQDFQLLMERSVEENLRFVLEATGWSSGAKMRERVEEVLEMVNLTEKMKRMPFQLSGGEQQRAAIARALLNNPPIILADEPTGNLDVETSYDVMDLIFRLHKENGTAVMMVTHNRHLFEKYPAPIYLCENGECLPYTIEGADIEFDELFQENRG